MFNLNIETDKLKRVAAYVTASTAEQAVEGYSIDDQIEKIQKMCREEGKVVVDVYADRGVSGKSIAKRLELQRLLKDCKKGLFDEVMVWKTNRLARGILDLAPIIKEFDKNNVTFKSIAEPFDTSLPTGKLIMAMWVSFAKFERASILESMRLSRKMRFRQVPKENGSEFLFTRSPKSVKTSCSETDREEWDVEIDFSD